MGNDLTIDNKVNEISLPKKIWDKGKYVLAFVATAYISNAGYHLVQAWIMHDKFESQRYEVAFKGLVALAAYDLSQEIGMSDKEADQRLTKTTNQMINELDKTSERMNHHLRRAFNPFY